MTSRNDITGDKLQTKPATKQYRDGWEAIFGKAGYPTPPTEKETCCGSCSPCGGHSKESDKEDAGSN